MQVILRLLKNLKILHKTQLKATIMEKKTKNAARNRHHSQAGICPSQRGGHARQKGQFIPAGRWQDCTTFCKHGPGCGGRTAIEILGFQQRGIQNEQD